MAQLLYVPDESVFGIAQQTTFGTVIADDGAFDQLVCDKVAFDMDVKKSDNPASSARRWTNASDLKRHTYGSMPTIKIPDHDLRKDQAAPLIYSLMQSVTEEAATPFQKVFVPHATQPDFTANAGCFLTGLIKMPVASKSIKVKDMICQSLNFKCSPGGKLTLAADLAGRGAASLISNPSGTWTIKDGAAADFFHFENIATYTYSLAGGGAVSPGIGGFEFNPIIEVVPAGRTSGEFQTFAIKRYGGTFKGSFIWNGTQHELLTNYPLGTEVAIILNWGSTGVDGFLQFEINGVMEAAEINYGDMIMADVTLNLAGDSSDTPDTEPFKITLADAQDKTW